MGADHGQTSLVPESPNGRVDGRFPTRADGTFTSVFKRKHLRRPGVPPESHEPTAPMVRLR